jgi:superfamily I DNA/RNA helicase
VGWDSPTGKQLRQFKERMSQQGMFRYQDMAALAGWYLKKHPMIADLLQERFLMVFFDEMQDTISEQECLLDALFPERSVVQRFGDDRQAIYHSTSDNFGQHNRRRVPQRASAADEDVVSTEPINRLPLAMCLCR